MGKTEFHKILPARLRAMDRKQAVQSLLNLLNRDRQDREVFTYDQSSDFLLCRRLLVSSV
jgi:hypothetical protein